LYEEDINSLAALAITNGCGDGLFCPNAVMTRAQVAVFLSRALDLPPATADHFTDTAESPFREDADALAEAGLTTGCGDGLFCPGAIASRSETASFVARAMDLQAKWALEEELHRRQPHVRLLHINARPL
jgi:hypothetical protein